MTAVDVRPEVETSGGRTGGLRSRAASAANRSWRPLVGSPLLVGLTVVVTWQLLVSRGVLDPFWFSEPTSIADRLAEWARTGELWTNVWSTLKVTAIGLGLSCITGAVIGSMQEAWGFFEEVTGFFVDVIYAVPKVILLPVLLFAFGFGDTSAIALVYLLTVCMLIHGVRGAYRGVDSEMTDAVRVLGGTRRWTFFLGALPQMAPQLLAVLRTSVPVAWIGAVFAEFFGTGTGDDGGLGQVIIISQQLFDATGMMTAIVVIAIIGSTFDWLLRQLDRRLDSWRPRAAGEGR